MCCSIEEFNRSPTYCWIYVLNCTVLRKFYLSIERRSVYDGVVLIKYTNILSWAVKAAEHHMKDIRPVVSSIEEISLYIYIVDDVDLSTFMQNLVIFSYIVFFMISGAVLLQSIYLIIIFTYYFTLLIPHVGLIL